MTNPYYPQQWEVAGFELCGWKQPDGSIVLGPNPVTGSKVKEWPKEVHVCGVTYTLEEEKWEISGFGWGVYV